MTSSHLASSRVNLAVLRESYRRELLDCLNKCEGTKALVWDDALTGPFGLIAEYSLLKERGVEKMFPLRTGRLPANTVKNIIFLVQPKCSLMEIVAQNVLKEEESPGHFKKDFHIFFVPRRSLLCEKKLKEMGVYGNFATVEEYCLDIIPLDSDVLSMELSDSFRECCLESDHTSMFHAAKALMTLQALYGVIPNIYSKGDCAERVVQMMTRMRRELAGKEGHVLPQIDNLLVLDRMVDPLTPLLSQLTYEGLIDEIYGINNTSVRLPPETFNAALGETATEMKKLELNSSSELFAELRDRNFNSVGPTLVRKVKLFTAQMDERHTAKIQELKQFVTKLPHMLTAKTSYSIHTTLAQLVRDVTEKDDFIESLTTQQELINEIGTDKSNTYIEDCIARREPIVKVLRLMCIQSYCNNGLKPKLLEFYKREIVQAYGFEHLVTLHNLERVGLMRTQGVGRTYSTVRKSLRLIDEKVNEQTPTDISYVYSGYAPLSVRLAQFLHRPGWRSITEVLALLPGSCGEDVQQIPGWLRNRKGAGSGGSTQSSSSEQKVTLVFFLGGVTYAEISALRFLSQQDDGMEYVIATTKVINGSTWLQSLMDTFTPKPPNPF